MTAIITATEPAGILILFLSLLLPPLFLLASNIIVVHFYRARHFYRGTCNLAESNLFELRAFTVHPTRRDTDSIEQPPSRLRLFIDGRAGIFFFLRRSFLSERDSGDLLLLLLLLSLTESEDSARHDRVRAVIRKTLEATRVTQLPSSCDAPDERVAPSGLLRNRGINISLPIRRAVT